MDHQQSRTDLREALEEIVGAEHVLTGDEDRAFYSQDIYRQADDAVAVVVRPGTTDEVSRAVAAATGAGYSVIARGGGSSYTGGLLPDRPDSVAIDTRRLDRIVEINTDDMYVVVEVGCTWKELHGALKPHGVRSPFWGPASGGTATVGGSLSQNAILHGSALYGASGESVLGLEVVLADGSIVPTGSWSTVGGKPFFRHYGPDLTGLFLGDTGALGVKTRAALRLMRIPQSARFASFEFTDGSRFAEAMGEVARSGLVSMCFGMDPVLQHQRMKRTSLAQDVKALKGVVTSAKNLGKGLKEAAKVALAGRSFLEEHSYSTHYIVEGRTETEVDEKLEAVRKICLQHGNEVENTLPKVLYGDSFFPMTTAIGPQGERWAPVHGIVPVGDAPGALAKLEGLFASHAEDMERLGVVIGILLSTVGTNGFVIEPVFYWPGPQTLYYKRVLEPSYLAKLTQFERSPDAEALVARVRNELIGAFSELGAVHLQVGKTYPYREGRNPNTWRLLEAVKDAVDPRRLVNPKSLGLD
ncbi:MAG: FAD-binding oxidoreductase [Candidatus Sulfomarinibacteraceae bacterium]